jgi:pyruvate/2-oxoglutarate dehydrogenase complex dihydrolipoamide acyltransferase (E2) component
MKPMQVTVDRDNVNDEFVVVRRIHKRHGETVRAEDLVLEIETSKTVTEIRAPDGGTLEIALSEGDEVAVGGLLFEVRTASAHVDVPSHPVEAAPALGQPASAPAEVAEAKVSREATAVAERLGVDVRKIPSRGWLTAADVLAAAGVSPPVSPDAAPAGAPAPTLPRTPFRSVRTSPRKRMEGRVLARANGSGTTSMIGVELALGGRRLVAAPYIFQDSVSDILIFEAARLLTRYPDLNACYIDEHTNAQFTEVNFGISFDSGQNLKVLALRGADRLSLSEVQTGFENLLQLYESEAPLADELLSSSTVTLSDLSRSGADFMLPLLNAGQSLIIGITRRAGGRFGVHASFDHRVSEGLQVARFLDELRERVQSHFRPAATAPASMPRCSVCDQTLQAEIEASGRGLLRIAQADGSDGYLCRNCFEGW